jgi:FNIP Repeat
MMLLFYLFVIIFLFIVHFNSPVNSWLPPKVTRITFGTAFNLRVDGLPNSIKHLSFGSNFNRYIANCFSSPPPPPNSYYFSAMLTDFLLPLHLVLGTKFNRTIDKLPPTLTHLTFGNNFKQNVDKLPSSLVSLHFGTNFNHTVDHLPPNLAELSFAAESLFNQLIDNLPPKLETLELGKTFNQPITSLPKQLSIIVFGDAFNRPIPELPTSIYSLALGKHYTLPLPPLPKLTFFFFNGVNIAGLEGLPSSITQIKFDGQYSHHFYFCSGYNIFFFTDNFDQAIDHLPTSLQQLSLSPVFNKLVAHLPSSLTKLTFGENFQKGGLYLFALSLFLTNFSRKSSIKFENT